MLTPFRERPLRVALRDSHYVFEPIVRLEDRSNFGYEALLRLPPGSRYANPVAVFAAAGRLRMARETDALTAAKAVREFAASGAQAGRMLFYNLHNLAITERRPRWSAAAAFRDAALPRGGGPFCIEVSEQTPLDEAGLRTYLERWEPRPLVALDDFGTGHSGLARLVTLRPDFVKIDRMFVAGIACDRKVASRLARIVDLIDDSGARTIVEGIETEAELEAAVAAGCAFGQGFLFGAALRSGGSDAPGGGTG